MEPIEVNEKQSGVYRAILRDDNGTPLPSLALDAFLLTLYDRASLATINSRNGQNALNTNQVTLDSLGNVEWTWLPADQPVLVPAKDIEEHVALFEAKWTDSNARPRQLNHEVIFRVHRVKKLA